RRRGVGREYVAAPDTGPFREEMEMRRNVALALAAALAGWMASATPAEASHCGACGFPAQTICAEQCQMPEVRYRVCYQTVVEEQRRVCYRPVYRTVMKECRSPSWRPVYEQHVRTEKYTVQKPVYEDYDVVRKYVVSKPVYEQHVRAEYYTVQKPVVQTY